MTSNVMGPGAALVGVLPAMQGMGVWMGRRQLFIRFAGEAETAVMYSAAALAEELRRLSARANFHSIALNGRDPLGNVECLQAALADANLPLPVLAESDGQRPEEVRALAPRLKMLQLCSDGTAGASMLGRFYATMGVAVECGLEHSLILEPGDQTTDAQLLRLIEQSHAVSEKVAMIIHPEEPQSGGPLDLRWSQLLAQAAELHDDVRILRRLLPPGEMRR